MSAFRRSLRKGKIFVISGPSGSGKTTLAKSILASPACKRALARSISFTTRERRSKEKNAKDYFFISKEEFRLLLKAKKILEWTKYLGYYYGTPKAYVDDKLKKGISIVLCLDHRGAVRIKKLYKKQAVTIFIMPSSITELSRRIKGRCHKTKSSEIKQRVTLAKKEIHLADKYDYCLVNKELAIAKSELKAIILAEIQPPH